MERLILERFAFTDVGTFGKMKVDDVTIYTIERPWLDNKPSVSCIPNGLYICKPRMFFRKGYMAIEITGVVGRSHILFHVANLPFELEGCIAPVSRIGVLNGQWGGLASGNAFRKLMEHFGGKTFELSIVPVIGGQLED